MGLVQKAEVGMCVLCAVALFSVPCTLPLIRIACLPSHQLSKIKKWRVKVKPHISLYPTQLHSGQTICGGLYLPSNMIFYRAICYSGIFMKGFASQHYFSDSLSARKRDSVNKTQTSTSECTCTVSILEVFQGSKLRFLTRVGISASKRWPRDDSKRRRPNYKNGGHFSVTFSLFSPGLAGLGGELACKERKRARRTGENFP